MIKTAEEIREEFVEKYAKELVSAHLEAGIGILDVEEHLWEEGVPTDDDLVKDVYNSANGTLDDLHQRYLDQDN